MSSFQSKILACLKETSDINYTVHRCHFNADLKSHSRFHSFFSHNELHFYRALVNFLRMISVSRCLTINAFSMWYLRCQYISFTFNIHSSPRLNGLNLYKLYYFRFILIKRKLLFRRSLRNQGRKYV